MTHRHHKDNCPICRPGRRQFLGLVAAAAGTAMLPETVLAAIGEGGVEWGRYSRRTRRLVRDNNVIDMLVSVRQAMVVKGQENSIEKAAERYLSWFRNPAAITEADIARYRTSGINTFYGAPDLGQIIPGATSFERGEYFFKGWRSIFALHPDKFLPIMDGNDLVTAPGSGRIGVILGLQNGDHFRTRDDVAWFYALGQRISQLTYNRENHLGGGAFTKIGLKPAGAQVIERMNEMGMVVDFAHASDQLTLDGIAASKVTPIISHSNCRALNPDFDRAVPDSVIKALAAKGGVIGITVLRQFVSPHEPTTIKDYVAHIDHVVQLAGIEHVGVGSDNDLTPFDGVDDAARDKYLRQSNNPNYKWRSRLGIDGLDHNRRIYDITEQLVRKGYKDRDIGLIIGGNWLRVLPKIWSTFG